MMVPFFSLESTAGFRNIWSRSVLRKCHRPFEVSLLLKYRFRAFLMIFSALSMGGPTLWRKYSLNLLSSVTEFLPVLKSCSNIDIWNSIIIWWKNYTYWLILVRKFWLKYEYLTNCHSCLVCLQTFKGTQFLFYFSARFLRDIKLLQQKSAQFFREIGRIFISWM